MALVDFMSCRSDSNRSILECDGSLVVQDALCLVHCDRRHVCLWWWLIGRQLIRRQLLPVRFRVPSCLPLSHIGFSRGLFCIHLFPIHVDTLLVVTWEPPEHEYEHDDTYRTQNRARNLEGFSHATLFAQCCLTTTALLTILTDQRYTLSLNNNRTFRETLEQRWKVAQGDAELSYSNIARFD